MNLRTVRKKTKSIRNVRKITKAMQLVSAIKMKKSQEREVEGRPYLEVLKEVINRIIIGIDTSSSQLLKAESNAKKRDLIILITSNKGLSGSFLVNLFRFLVKSEINFSGSDFVTVGTKGSLFVGRMGSKIIADYSSGKPLDEVSAIFSFVLQKYLVRDYRSVLIIFNKYISTFKSETVMEKLLPFSWDKKLNSEKILTPGYLIEPNPEEILDSLLKSYLEEMIRGTIISSEAVEHAARMMAMKNATDNATDIIYNLTLVGNKLRQEKITNELLDMITAKELVEIEN